MKRLCPICGRATDSTTSADFPFCGPRCRLIDLGRWSAEEYRFSEAAAQKGQTAATHDEFSSGF